MNKTKYIVLVILLVLGFQNLIGQTVFYQGSWEQLLDKAQTENKPIFVDLYFTGCMPCKEMDKQVFPDPKVARILNNEFIPFKVNVFKEEEKALGLKLSKKYAITGFPSFLILTPDNQVVDIDGGFMRIDNFLRFLNEARVNYSKDTYKSYSNSYNMDYPEFYVNYFEKRKLDKSAVEINDYLDSLSNVDEEIPFLIMFKLLKEGKYVEYYANHLEEYGKKYGTSRVAMSMISKIDYLVKYYGKTNNLEKYEEVIGEIERLMAPDDWERIRLKCFYKPYYDVTKDVNWFLEKIENGQFSWPERSNAYAKVIVQSKNNESVLKQLQEYYENNSDKQNQSEVYKEVLINLFLKDYKNASEVLKYIDNTMPSPGITEDVVNSLKLAVQNKDLTKAQVLAAEMPLPYVMN